MAELYDAHGNPVQLTDEFGNPVTLTDERGNPVHLTGIATEPGQDVYELAEAVASSAPTGISRPANTGYGTLGGGTHIDTPIAEAVGNGTHGARDSATTGSTLGVAPPIVTTGMGTGGDKPLRRSGSSSSSSSEDDGQGGRRRKKKGLKDKIMEKLAGGKKEEEQQQPPAAATTIGGGNTTTATTTTTTTTSSAGGEVHQKKSVMEKIKEKLPGHHSHN